MLALGKSLSSSSYLGISDSTTAVYQMLHFVRNTISKHFAHVTDMDTVREESTESIKRYHSPLQVTYFQDLCLPAHYISLNKQSYQGIILEIPFKMASLPWSKIDCIAWVIFWHDWNSAFWFTTEVQKNNMRRRKVVGGFVFKRGEKTRYVYVWRRLKGSRLNFINSIWCQSRHPLWACYWLQIQWRRVSCPHTSFAIPWDASRMSNRAKKWLGL